jgi:hypothetical protein
MLKALFVFILIGRALAWAGEDPPAPALIKPNVSVHSILGATVKSVSRADAAKGTRSEIVVKDTAGKLTHILVTPTTTLWDIDAKGIILTKIAPKKRVNIIYLTTDEGINIGKSIKVIK